MNILCFSELVLEGDDLFYHFCSGAFCFDNDSVKWMIVDFVVDTTGC